MKSKQEEYEDLKKFLATPRDLKDKSLEEQANIITLYFIGYLAKPVGISDELLNKCLVAFNNNRGKCEWEETAVLEVLKGHHD